MTSLSLFTCNLFEPMEICVLELFCFSFFVFNKSSCDISSFAFCLCSLCTFLPFFFNPTMLFVTITLLEAGQPLNHWLGRDHTALWHWTGSELGSVDAFPDCTQSRPRQPLGRPLSCAQGGTLFLTGLCLLSCLRSYFIDFGSILSGLIRDGGIALFCFLLQIILIFSGLWVQGAQW